MTRRRRRPGGLAARHFGIVDQQVDGARAAVDADAVAVLHQRERAADRGLRRNMSDAHAARRAGEAPVGEQRDLLAHLLAVDDRGGAEHLAHAGAALRALVADDQHFAGLVVALAHRRGAGILAVEHARDAFEHQRLQAGDLQQRAVGREIAFQHHKPAIGADRVLRAPHDLAVRVGRAGMLFRKRAAGDGQAIAVQVAASGSVRG